MYSIFLPISNFLGPVIAEESLWLVRHCKVSDESLSFELGLVACISSGSGRMPRKDLRKGEARKLEHHYPQTIKVKYRESLHQSSQIHVPTFCGSLFTGNIEVSKVGCILPSQSHYTFLPLYFSQKALYKHVVHGGLRNNRSHRQTSRRAEPDQKSMLDPPTYSESQKLGTWI